MAFLPAAATLFLVSKLLREETHLSLSFPSCLSLPPSPSLSSLSLLRKPSGIWDSGQDNNPRSPFPPPPPPPPPSSSSSSASVCHCLTEALGGDCVMCHRSKKKGRKLECDPGRPERCLLCTLLPPCAMSFSSRHLVLKKKKKKKDDSTPGITSP